MKVNFTRLAIFALAIGVNYSAFSQNWELSGNAIGATDYLGTNNNFPLLFRTANVNRMKLNGTTSYAVNSWNSSRDGFLLLGSNTGTLYSTGAFSLLHLNGPAGA